MRIFFVILCLVRTLEAATYYVAKTGNDANPGTIGSPFLTVQKGADSAHAGDTVLVGAGTYAELIRTDANAGTSGSPIIFDGQNVATINSFYVENAYLIVRNFTVSGQASGPLLFVRQKSHFGVFTNNVFDCLNNDQIIRPIQWEFPNATGLPFGEAGSSNFFCWNELKNAKAEVCMKIYGHHNTIGWNYIHDADNADWFHLQGGTNYIVGNTCSNLWYSGTNPNHADFVQIFGDSGTGSLQYAIDNLVESNLVFKADNVAQLGNLTDDSYLDGSGRPYVRGLIFRNNIFQGVAAKISIAMQDVKFYNNVFSDCSTNAVNGGPLLVFTDSGSIGKGHGGQAFNNVFLNCGIPGDTNTGGTYFSTTLTNVASDYNFTAKAGHLPVKADPSHRAVGDPGGWDTTDWGEPHGINGGDPLFVAEGTDFHLQAGSPLIGAALQENALFTTDLAGVTRGSVWDIGAYEYASGGGGGATVANAAAAGAVAFNGGVTVK